jgi:hypothetical protein
MKKVCFLSILAAGLLIFSQQSNAQEKLTTKSVGKNQSYKVINNGEAILIYKHADPSHPPKEAEKYAPTYFFVTSSSDELMPLSKMNLKKAFPVNHPFHDALDENFKEDKELINYDEFHKMYKINWLLKNHS